MAVASSLLLLCGGIMGDAPAQGSLRVPDLAKINTILEGDDLNARLALLADLKQAGRDVIPLETQDYLIDRAIRDFEERMDHGMLVDRFTDYARYLNKKFDAKEKLRSEITREQMKLALTFHRPAFLPRLVLVIPGWNLLKAYQSEGLQAMINQGEAIMRGRRYSMMAHAVEQMMLARGQLDWQPTPEQVAKVRFLMSKKLDELEKQEKPCGYPESPEVLIEALIALESPGIQDQAAQILNKCLPFETAQGTLLQVRFMSEHHLPGTVEVMRRLIASEPAGPIREYYLAIVAALASGTELPSSENIPCGCARERDDLTRKGKMDSLRSVQLQQLKILGIIVAVGTVMTLALGIWWWRWIKRRKVI